jgi:hypothetical protein
LEVDIVGAWWLRVSVAYNRNRVDVPVVVSSGKRTVYWKV